jgi:hypothetical protein
MSDDPRERGPVRTLIARNRALHEQVAELEAQIADLSSAVHVWEWRYDHQVTLIEALSDRLKAMTEAP